MFPRRSCARCPELEREVTFLRDAASERERQISKLQEAHDALLVRLAKFDPIAEPVIRASR